MAASYMSRTGTAGMLRVFFGYATPKIAIQQHAKALHSAGTRALPAKAEPEQQNPEGPEYIPRRKAKNPMKKVGWAWFIGMPSGIISFILAKREVDKNRLKQLKVRQRMKVSNEGEYERVRYKPQKAETESIVSPRL